MELLIVFGVIVLIGLFVMMIYISLRRHGGGRGWGMRMAVSRVATPSGPRLFSSDFE